MSIIAVLHAGERALARQRFAELWTRVEGRDAFHECVLCHYMADAQDDPAEELCWDRRALDAALVARSTDGAREEPSPFGVTLASFFPSLHLNLAADLHALGDRALARAHLLEARRSLDGLADADPDLARLTRQAIDRLARRLDEGD